MQITQISTATAKTINSDIDHHYVAYSVLLNNMPSYTWDATVAAELMQQHSPLIATFRE